MMGQDKNQDTEIEKQEKPYAYEKYIRISQLLKKLKIQDSCRTLDCAHQDGCIYNVFNQLFKGLALGYAAKTTLNIVSTILQFKKLLKNPLMLIKALFNGESLRFALFPAVYNLVMQSSLCLMRRKGVNKNIQGFVSGFLGGYLALATRQKQNRNIWGVMLLARAVDCIYKSMCNRNIIQKRSTDYTLMFSSMYLVFSISYGLEPECLPPSFNKFLRAFSNEHDADLKFRGCWIAKSNLELIKKGIPPHDVQKALLLDFNRKR
ncbi:hypothetical protein ABPG72_006051 [Tetrahymena utriculariae]